jgi:hypothetical protein
MNSVTRSAFLAMSHPAKMSHIRSGFPIIEDEVPVDPYADATRIVDARERLRWIESKKRWDAETAKMKADNLAKEQAEFAAWKASR